MIATSQFSELNCGRMPFQMQRMKILNKMKAHTQKMSMREPYQIQSKKLQGN